MKTLVTGGSKGIGLACALAQAKQGHETWIAARGEQGLEQALAHATNLGLTLQAIRLDVTDLIAVERAFLELGELDILVQAAGCEAFSQLETPEDPQHWRQVLASNLDGTYYCLRAALKAMTGRLGRIVVISSVLGLRGMRHSHAYCAAKHGVIGLVKALALDYASSGITVNAVCPGWVRTAMAERSMTTIAQYYGLSPEDFIQAELQAVPIGRWIEPEEVAELVCQVIASPALTGQALEISGGLG